MTHLKSAAALLALLIGASATVAATPKAAQPEPGDWLPVAGKFPPPDSGHYFAGELVLVDAINRRGGLRLDGDSIDDRYDKADPHLFQMLPYGMIRYHGAPAELADVPIGTHLHGTFYFRPEGDTTIPEPTGHGAKYVPKYPYALLLEDDSSFYQRRGQTWKIVEVDPPRGPLLSATPGAKVEPGKLKVVAEGRASGDGLLGEQTFTLDASTRVWKGRESLTIDALAPGQQVQVNLTWCEWWAFKKFHVADVWIDQQARDVAAERQRQVHIRQTQYYWMPAWIEATEQLKGGTGIATITLFGGMDESLYQDVARRVGDGVRVAVAEDTLRSWWQDHDHRPGRIIEIERDENPPPGSSGIKLRVQIGGMLEGFRPGRVIRIGEFNWPSVKLPPEYRMKWDLVEREILSD